MSEEFSAAAADAHFAYGGDSAMRDAAVVITGANGYLGRRLASFVLSRTGVKRVVMFDVTPHIRDPDPPVNATRMATRELVKVSGDIRDATLVTQIMTNAVDDCTVGGAGPVPITHLVVFHVASYGMSGREMVADPARVTAINVGGSNNILNALDLVHRRSVAAAAATATRSGGGTATATTIGAGGVGAAGVSRRCVLVYTSTYNVVFGGDPANAIANGDEHTPYLPLSAHCDLYSKTKSIAEQLVLRRGPECGIATVALRSAGIYGDGEERHLPRIVSLLHAGLFRFTIGAADTKVEFVYVDNLTHAHILAALALLRAPAPQPLTTADRPPVEPLEHLVLSRNPKAAAAAAAETAAAPVSAAAGPSGGPSGRGYFISDGEPMNNFEFFRPLVQGLGFSYPTLNIPYALAFRTAHAIELLHRAVAPLYNFQPLLSRAEVNKVAVTHYFQMAAAKRDFGYTPHIPYREGMRRVVAHFRAAGHTRKPSPLWQPLLLLLVLCVLMALLWLYRR